MFAHKFTDDLQEAHEKASKNINQTITDINSKYEGAIITATTAISSIKRGDIEEEQNHSKNIVSPKNYSPVKRNNSLGTKNNSIKRSPAKIKRSKSFPNTSLTPKIEYPANQDVEEMYNLFEDIERELITIAGKNNIYQEPNQFNDQSLQYSNKIPLPLRVKYQQQSQGQNFGKENRKAFYNASSNEIYNYDKSENWSSYRTVTDYRPTLPLHEKPKGKGRWK